MADALNIALAQLNPVVGDLDGNAGRLLAVWRDAADKRFDLLVATELYLSGYPPEDMVMRAAFQEAVASQVQRLARATADGGPWIVVGAPWRDEEQLFNAALVLGDGAIQAACRKHDLPNFSVFDEKRVFAPGPMPHPVAFRGTARLGILVCQDMWSPGPSAALKEAGADVLIAINSSPFDTGKLEQRDTLAAMRVRETGLPLIYTNQVGGQDELVFDGTSFAFGADGTLLARAQPWKPDVVAVRLRGGEGGWRSEAGTVHAAPEELEMIYHALVLGLRDYVGKNGFEGVVLGLSGGIDSSLSAVVAVDALGASSVRTVMLQSRYTSPASVRDAADCADRLDVRLGTMTIQPAVEAFAAILEDTFAGRREDTTEENIQARVRAVILMALSNKFGHLLLTTGNKSEMSVGYATLYGDMSGGFSVLKDVYKTTVYALARWRNHRRPDGGLGPAGAVIPDSVLVKAPSAELKPKQTDQDTLPPYEELDDILKGLVEDEMTNEAIAARGHAAALVAGIEDMLYAAEYKRRQAPPGVRITRRNFGRDRRYPITNHFREGPAGDGGRT